MYIHQHPEWPNFTWDKLKIGDLLTTVRYRQGILIGRMQALGFNLREAAMLQTLTQDVLKTSEIEGDLLDQQQVRSSLAKRLGIAIAGAVIADRNVEGIVEMMIDATQNFNQPLSAERLFRWHAALFATGGSGIIKITSGQWRTGYKGPMQVVSGTAGRETIHFEAPDAVKIEAEMTAFIRWYNAADNIDAVLKAAIAHFWFVTIHPFEDGNGRIARAIADMQMARADDSSQRFYSMSAQIRKERNDYYEVLERTQKGTPDLTAWLKWFLNCFNRAILATDDILANVLTKARFYEKYAGVALNNRQRLLTDRLLSGIEGKMTSSKWANMAKCSQDTAARDIQDLVQKGILEKEEAGGRSTRYKIKEEGF